MWKKLSPLALTVALAACGPAMYAERGEFDRQYAYAQINPDISAPGSSWGGTRSERVDNETAVPLPEGSPFAGTVAMGEWHGEASIEALEMALLERGYDPGVVDGKMDEETRAALAQMQRDAGLPVTGTLDADTARALGLDYVG